MKYPVPQFQIPKTYGDLAFMHKALSNDPNKQTRDKWQVVVDALIKAGFDMTILDRIV